jgi:hypothetical protein
MICIRHLRSHQTAASPWHPRLARFESGTPRLSLPGSAKHTSEIVEKVHFCGFVVYNPLISLLAKWPKAVISDLFDRLFGIVEDLRDSEIHEYDR